MAKRKRKVPQIELVAPDAIGLRSMAVGWCTAMFDASFLPTLNSAGFNPFTVARKRQPKKEFDRLRRLAGQGKWLAIRSHPEIVDGDGVPGLDFVFPGQHGKRRTAVKPKQPQKGVWFDDVSQSLDLPSGQLMVVYEEEFFEPGFDQDQNRFHFDSSEAVSLDNRSFLDAVSYVVPCEPGFYDVHTFSRDVEIDTSTDMPIADLAVYFVPKTKPKSFRLAEAVLPFHSPDLDIQAHRRKARGLPPEKRPAKPTMLKSGEYRGEFKSYGSSGSMVMPPEFRDELKLKPGMSVQLDANGQTINGVYVKSTALDKKTEKLVEKAKRNFKHFALFSFENEFLTVCVIKSSRKEPLEMEAMTTYPASFQVVRNAEGKIETLAPPARAKAKKASVPALVIPNGAGKSGPAVDELATWIEKTFSWTQECEIEIGDTTMIARINACPPRTIRSARGGDVEMAAEINATIEQQKKGKVTKQSDRTFRGWPGGLHRAFAWIAKQAKGGAVQRSGFGLTLDFFDTKRTITKRDANPIAAAAWAEVLGVEI